MIPHTLVLEPRLRVYKIYNGQRATWANGDKGGFYPYGKTQAQLLAEQD